MSRTVGCLPLSEACMVLYGIMNASPQEETFELIPAQGPLGPGSDVHDVFRHRDLPFTLMLYV